MVGLQGFNDDATEAAGMALFSINVLAARPEANTDDEVDSITRLVAHEFFHHWSGAVCGPAGAAHDSALLQCGTQTHRCLHHGTRASAPLPAGNRVTLCDWLNLTVKEGLTVYREQQFMADLDAAAAAVAVSPDWADALLQALHAHTQAAAAEGAGASRGQLQEASWKRVQDTAYLRSEQFPEDAGPLAHAIRPAAVSSLSSLYTDTVYAKVRHRVGAGAVVLAASRRHECARLAGEAVDARCCCCLAATTAGRCCGAHVQVPAGPSCLQAGRGGFFRQQPRQGGSLKGRCA